MDYITLKNRVLNSKLINDSFWSLIGNVIGKGLSLAAGIFVARFLGKEVFGEYGIVKNTIMLIAIFSTLGMGYTATKFVAEYKNKKSEYTKLVLLYTTRITLAFSAVMALILFTTAEYVAENVLSDLHLKNPLRILSIVVVFNALTTMQIGVLAGFGKFKEMARINSIVGGVTFIASLSLTYYFGFNGALVALLIAQILNWFLNYKEVKKSSPKGKAIAKNNKLVLKQLFDFSLPVALLEAQYSLTQWLGNILIIRLASFGELGLYTATMQWNSIILFIPGILRNVILSHLSEANKFESAHSRILKLSLIINFSATLIPALCVLLFSKIIGRLYGISFEGLNELISISVFTTVFLSLSNVYDQAFMSKGLNWTMFVIRLFSDIIILATFIIGITYFEFEGARAMIYSTLIISVLTLLVMMIIYRRSSTTLDNNNFVKEYT